MPGYLSPMQRRLLDRVALAGEVLAAQISEAIKSIPESTHTNSAGTPLTAQQEAEVRHLRQRLSSMAEALRSSVRRPRCDDDTLEGAAPPQPVDIRLARYLIPVRRERRAA